MLTMDRQSNLFGLIGIVLLTLVVFGIHAATTAEERHLAKSRPPLVAGELWSELGALHQAATAGTANLLAPKSAQDALFDLRVQFTRAAPSLEPEARLVGGAALGDPMRPLTFTHFERADGTRFSLFTLHSEDAELTADATPVPSEPIASYRLVRDGAQLTAWIHPVASSVYSSSRETRWTSVAVGGPASDDPFWNTVRKAQRH